MLYAVYIYAACCMLYAVYMYAACCRCSGSHMGTCNLNLAAAPYACHSGSKLLRDRWKRCYAVCRASVAV